MYNTSAGAGAVGGATIPVTGLAPLTILFVMLAAFALLSVGGALLRVAPSLHTHPDSPVRQRIVHPRKARTRRH